MTLLYVEEDETVDEAPRPVAKSQSVTDKLGVGEPWEQVRDYVVRETEARFGPTPIEPFKMNSIFKAFVKRHGFDRSMAVARKAFDTYDGIWASAPITPYRFTTGNDPFFADVIIKDHAL